MQTFLPYPDDFRRSALALDHKRLGKQRVETLQLLNSLTGVRSGWRQHPALRMWVGYEAQLVRYGVAICDEWIQRGFKDTCRDKILDHLPVVLACRLESEADEDPMWVRLSYERKRLGSSHRWMLHQKSPGDYPQFCQQPEPEGGGYFWPQGCSYRKAIWDLVES